MKKKLAKKVRVKKRGNNGLREGYIKFEGRKIHVKAISHSHQTRINDKYYIPKLQAKLGYLELEKNNAKDVAVQTQLRLAISDIAGDLKIAMDRATIETIMDMVTEPHDNWFETLGPDQWLALTTKADFFGRFVDLDEMGFEIIKELEEYYGLKKPKDTFKGEDIGKKIAEIKLSWMTLGKKKSNLSTVSSRVNSKRANTAISTYQDGLSG